MKRGLLTLALAGMGMSTAAPAAEWVYLTTSESKIEIFVDTTSITREGAIVTAWSKWDHSRNPNVRYREEKRQNVYNCSGASSALVYAIEYFPDGQTKTYGPWSPSWSPVVPETIGESVFNFVCGR